MISVSEATDWNVRGSVQSKYRAMSCQINCIDPDDPMHGDIKNKVIESQIEYVIFCRVVFAFCFTSLRAND